jgi:hypothetical protein
MRTHVVRRDAAVQVRLGRRELDRWRPAAASNELTVSEFIRACVRARLAQIPPHELTADGTASRASGEAAA